MKNLSIILACCLWASCNIIKSGDKLQVAVDSLSVQHRTIVTTQAERDYLQEEYMMQYQQWLEIDAEAPYRWHPDSGLCAGAGYLRIKVKKSQIGSGQQKFTSDTRLKVDDNLRRQDKLKIQQEQKKVQTRTSYIKYGGWLFFVAVAILLYIVLRKLGFEMILKK